MSPARLGEGSSRVFPPGLWVAVIVLIIVVAAGEGRAQPVQVLLNRPSHLRSGAGPEWDEFQGKTPDGAGLVLPFPGEATTQEVTLLIAQDNVKLDWRVELNGKKLGTLFLMEAPLIQTLAVPPGTLRNGLNELSIVGPKENDDVLVGEISLHRRPVKEVLGDATLALTVVDEETGTHLPCRLTVVDAAGRLAPLLAEGANLAVRPGVIYTGDGRARVGVLSGTYHIYATRGFEYSLGSKEVTVTAGQEVPVVLQLRREVSTPGWVCSDTHIHTGTFARHGDATVEERALTLAGEGIELPISTEHDLLVDLSGPAAKAGVAAWFTPVVGDEVTTAKGHFNIFPVSLSAPVPDRKITDWPALMDQFRRTPGVEVVVLNHPRNIHGGFQPFASTNFNALTGENLRGFEFEVDAIEVANSSALQSDWMASFRDWFSLLNYGYRMTAVGSSDGHDVSRYIIGQGRTYIVCDDSNPARIDVREACRNLKQGRALVSLGLLTDLRVDEKYGVGSLATNLGAKLHVQVTVQSPSWAHADRLELYANGVRILDRAVWPLAEIPKPGQGIRLRLEIDIPRPKRDVHLIALASGPGVLEPYWAIARPYQPSSSHWEPRVVGATNPIWIDADGDGQFTSARAYAQGLLRQYGDDSAGLLAALVDCDPAIVTQARSLLLNRSQNSPEDSQRRVPAAPKP